MRPCAASGPPRRGGSTASCTRSPGCPLHPPLANPRGAHHGRHHPRRPYRAARAAHELIFDTFAALPAGDGFELVNDHDPKPLYYQLEAEQTGRFTWDYVEQGPEVWRVRIGRSA